MKNLAASLLMSAVFVVLGTTMISRVPLWNASFKTFYCAGRTIDAGRDPYRVEPLRSCERSLNPKALPAGLVEPAPLPGFSLAPFALLAHLPPQAAQTVYTAAMLLAVLLAAFLLSACTGASMAAIVAVFTAIALLNLAFGEIPPFCALAIAGAAYAVTAKRWHLAGICAALAMIQPQIGLAALLSTLVWIPRARIAALVTVAALVLVSLATFGTGGNLEYFRDVLPVQAYSELVAADQYSFSRLLYIAGVPDRWALLGAQAQYAVMLIGGTLLARYAARMWNAPALLAALPPAIVMIGGMYLHDVQIVTALPAAVIVASVAKSSRFQIAAFAALLLLAVVWTEKPGRQLLVTDAFAVAGAAAVALGGNLARRASVAVGGAIVVFTLLAAIDVVQSAAPPGALETNAAFSAGTSANESASVVWAKYLRATPALTRRVVLPKVPTWAGLLLLLGVSALPLTRPSRNQRLPEFFADSSQGATTL